MLLHRSATVKWTDRWVKVGGVNVIVGGFLAMLPTISLNVMIIALEAGLALVGFGME